MDFLSSFLIVFNPSWWRWLGSILYLTLGALRVHCNMDIYKSSIQDDGLPSEVFVDAFDNQFVQNTDFIGSIVKCVDNA